MRCVYFVLGLYILFTYPAWAVKDSAKVAGTYDDCHLEKSTPASTDYYVDNSNMYLGKYDATYDSMALAIRLRSIPINRSATIDSAFLYLYAVGTYTTDTVRTEIKMEAAANPSAFLTRGGGGLADLQGRARTTAHKDTVFGHTSPGYYRVGGNFGSVLQEVVNSSNWDNGDNMVVFLNNRGSTTGAFRQFYSYEISSTNSAYVLIYSNGGGSPAVDSSKTSIHSPANTYKVHSPAGIGAIHKP